ncbi:RibD family protein [Rubrivivax sp. RP6-9]|uniref:RibD family protein n=1 Tax=Rubrivivax sp. RP6-9 TaxID=3415750 RepID=UPI003CC53816
MPTPDPPLPDDWPALWQRLLHARAQAAAAPPPDGTLSAASAALLAVYQPLLQARQAIAGSAPHGHPGTWTVAQLGQSLDGCVATAAGDSYYVTGPQSLLHLHRLRALCDAVLVGAGTVAADDPQLTTRRVPGPNPVRVVLDPAARLDGRARLLRDAAAPTLWLCDARHAAAARERLQGGAAEVVAVPALLDAADPARGPDPARVLATLAARGLRLVFVEGGGVTVSRFLAAGALDRLHLVIAPVVIGDGRRGLQGAGPARMADCLRPPAQRLALGDDMLWDLDLRPR